MLKRFIFTLKTYDYFDLAQSITNLLVGLFFLWLALVIAALACIGLFNLTVAIFTGSVYEVFTC